MIDPVIGYANTLIGTLGFSTHGLTELVVVSEEVTAPGVYVRGGEFKPPSFEKPMVYHRITGGPVSSRAEGEVAKLSIITRTWTLRCVAGFPRDMYGTDTGDTESDVAIGIANQLEDTNITSLATQMVVTGVSMEAGDADVGRSVWEEEFEGVDYNAKVGLCAVEYTIAITAPEDCFPNPGCDDTPIDVAAAIQNTFCGADRMIILGEVDAATITVNLGTEISELADGIVDAEKVTNIAAGWTVSLNGGPGLSSLVGKSLNTITTMVFTITTTPAGSTPRIDLTL